MMLCPYCGAKVHEEACFCVECGSKLERLDGSLQWKDAPLPIPLLGYLAVFAKPLIPDALFFRPNVGCERVANQRIPLGLLTMLASVVFAVPLLLKILDLMSAAFLLLDRASLAGMEEMTSHYCAEILFYLIEMMLILLLSGLILWDARNCFKGCASKVWGTWTTGCLLLGCVFLSFLVGASDLTVLFAVDILICACVTWARVVLGAFENKDVVWW